MSEVRFGKFELNLRTGELRSGNTSMRLAPQPAKVLKLLVSRTGELVSREEIEREIWGEHTTVDFDSSLNSCIKQIRRALGDDAGNPRYIQTLPRRGYRFIAPVVRKSHHAKPSNRVVVQSVTVLPTRVVSSSQDSFLTDAIPNTLTSYLAQIEGLETKLPPTAIELERLGNNLDRVATTYRVSAFVQPTLIVQGARYALTLQLVEAPSRRLLWADEFEGERSGYLELLREAGESLHAAIRPADVPVTVHVGVSSDSEAELAFQRGLYYSNRFNNLHQHDDFLHSASAFRRALELDPGLSDAAAESAWLYDFKIESGAPVEDALPQLDTWVRRSLEIDPNNGRAWALITLMEANRASRDLRKMLTSGLRAVSFAPRYARAHHSLSFPIVRGSCTLAVAALREASRLEPLYLYSPTVAGYALTCMGRPEEALQSVETVLEIEPHMSMALMVKGAALRVLKGPRRSAETVRSLGPVHPAWLHWSQDLTLLGNEDDGSTDTVRERLVSGATGQTVPFPFWPDVTRVLVPVLARAGRVDEALDVLNQRITAGVIPPYDYLMLNPDLESVRAEPSFRAVAERSRNQFEEMVAELEATRANGVFPAYLEEPLADLMRELNLAEK